MKFAKPRPKHLLAGDSAEQLALTYLKKHKLKLVEQNYHCPFGELDLIMQDQQSLVIVEVRYRKSQQFGGAVASITSQKQSRIIAAAGHYLSARKVNAPVRFDVIAINGEQQINWIKHAFQT